MSRRRFVRFLNAVIVCSLLGLLMVHLQNQYPTSDDETKSSLDSALSRNPMPYFSEFNSNSEEGWATPNAPTPLSKEEIVRSIEFLNANYEVLNVDKYGPVQNISSVIVVQVHNRIEYLRYLIETLESSKYISESLLIFSHDFSSAAINRLIRSITFCRVIQIFYPYSIQLFPNVYPGQSSSDCPEKISKEKAKEVRCENWMHPDKYGHYRIAQLTQIKHHWWWKMNYVFDGVMTFYNLTNAWVVLLEEDHYVSPDFLHVMRLIVNNKQKFCDDCQVISLGTYLKSYNNYESDIASLGVHPWFSSKHNMGMVISSKTWRSIKKCKELFCKYDDYNWDWSLLFVSTKCLPNKLRVIEVKASRVIHVGDCGVHTHRCAVRNAAEQARGLFARVAGSLFPDEMHVVVSTKRTLKASKENGGWGDARDHELCLNNTHVLNLGDFHYDLHNRLSSTNQTQPLLYPL